MSEMQNATVICLTPQVRTLLNLMSFPEIAPEANYLCFDEDGNVQMLEEFETGWAVMPKMTLVSYYTDVMLQLEE